MSYRMNKKQAEQEFIDYVMPSIREQEREYGNGKDIIMRSEAWNDFTDMLCKEGRITNWQYENWSHPSCCN